MRRQAAVYGEPSSSSSSSKNREETIYSGFVPLRKHARMATTAAEMSGLPADVGGVFPSPTSSHKKPEAIVWKGEEADDEPMYGVVSVMGRSRKMEDMVTVRPSLCKPEINQQNPVHFFAVYDGHGGSQVKAIINNNFKSF